MSPVRIFLSASFPRVSLQFRPWQRHLIAATDSSQTPCKLLPASCVRFLSMSRQRTLGVLSASSQSSLGLLSASSHCFSARMYCLDSHVEPWRPLRTSSHRRRTRRSLHAFIIFPALRVHIPRLNFRFFHLLRRILHFFCEFLMNFFRISRQIPENSDVCRFSLKFATTKLNKLEIFKFP